MRDYSEDALVEQPAIDLFRQLGWEAANCYHETFGPGGTLGRANPSEVVLVRRLRAALEQFNPGLPTSAYEDAIVDLTRDRSTMLPATANREVYRLLKDGVKLTYRDERDQETTEALRVIDWTAPERNDYFLASQLWITGDLYKRRADLVGFVNGIPVVFIELKATHRRLDHAYADNLRDYRTAIPQLFVYNGLIILSNGSETRVGSMTAGWEHFAEWKKIDDEDEEGRVSLETVIHGVCEQTRLLDLVENFTVFSETGTGLSKILARNHQYLGVNNAIAAVRAIQTNQGRLGVFWHTQGSGKSYSMVFFSQKVLRKLPGNWTFLIVTDREDLDTQIYKTFAGCGAVNEPEELVHADSGAHLQQLLREDHRAVFTLVQKFRTEPGVPYPLLSDRRDIIVITDEAHRTQYDTLALNMRNALPNAAFLAFTGTPLIVGEEKTREVFGDYVSVYNFRQSIEDGATVPLYYENRIPELQLTNLQLNEDLEALVEAAELDEDQERKLEREFAREYHLITRDDRLERIAADIVTHFVGRGQVGKAMVVSIDKATAVRMYDKVHAHWLAHLAQLRERARTAPPVERERLLEQIRFMETTDMAVVVSQGQNEIEDFRAKGLEIAPHRRRMVKEDLESKFKDPTDPLRIVFVCAMWMTGFDVPSLSTVYLDKPMRNHTLMQTIARANRVFADKTNGLIVDYVGVFRDLQKALAIYGTDRTGRATAAETPVQDKAELLAALQMAIEEISTYCALHDVDTQAIMQAAPLQKIALLDAAVDTLLATDEIRRHYLALAASVAQLYRAILPDTMATVYTPAVSLFTVLAKKMRATLPEPDIAGVMEAVERLLDASIASEGYVIAGTH